MRRQWSVIFLVLGFLAGTGISGQSQTLVLQGGTLIDGTGGNPISDAVIVIEGSRIRAVGPKGRVSYPQNARIVNTEGHYEMQMLVDLGIPPMKAIQGATLWGAESIGQGKDLGTIERGKLADITVIEGNPLNDIAATKNIRIVIKDGKVLDTTYDPRFVNPIPRPRGGY